MTPLLSVDSRHPWMAGSTPLSISHPCRSLIPVDLSYGRRSLIRQARHGNRTVIKLRADGHTDRAGLVAERSGRWPPCADPVGSMEHRLGAGRWVAAHGRRTRRRGSACGSRPLLPESPRRVQAAVATGWTEGCPSMPGARLTSEERAKIEVLFGEGYTFPQIAKAIGRDRTTVWREVRRNNSHNGLVGVGARHPLRRCAANPTGLGGAYRWAYCARDAQRRAQARARRPREGKLRPRRGGPWPPLWAEVKAKLMLRWSPVQIARWLRRRYPDQPERWVSHETIYQAIFYQARGGMRQELARQVALRSGRTAR